MLVESTSIADNMPSTISNYKSGGGKLDEAIQIVTIIIMMRNKI